MRSFFYKAHDEAGRKRTGVIEAPHREDADAELRKSGLRPYFLHDYHKLKQILHRKQRKRRQMILIGSAVTTVLAVMFSVFGVRYAGRERAPRIDDYKRTGIIEGNPGLIQADTKQQRKFALDIHGVWESFCPDVIQGIEVTNILMTVWVTRKVRNLSDNELEVLASNAVRALHRQFGANACTLLVVEGNDRTILEVNYNAITKSTRLKSYR